MSLRILVLTASVGSGHNRAAEAIDLALREQSSDVAVERIDVLDMAWPLFRRCYSAGYFKLIAKAPHLVGYLYDRLDETPALWQRPVDHGRKRLQKFSLRALIRHLATDAWDLVICTHFLPAEIVATMRRQRRMNCPMAVVTTDFDTHRLWYANPCDHYFTATDDGKVGLQRWGVLPSNISVTGIPIDSKFRVRRTKLQARRELGLDAHRPLVLQLSGGVGIGPIEQIHRELLSVATPLQIVAITGRNEHIRKTLNDVEVPRHHDRQVLGFTDQIDKYMAAADLVISKPGGLTVSESLCRGLPMMIVDPIPGQEARNSDYLLENGAAVKINGLVTIKVKVESLLNDPARLRRMSDAALSLAKPDAASAVADQCVALLRPSREAEPKRSSRLDEYAYL